MKIKFFEIKNWEKKYLEEKLVDLSLDLEFFTGALNKSALVKIKDTNILVPFIYSQVNKNVLSNLPKLKYVTTMSTGFDHIDIEECKKRKIKVSNVPSYGENTVAEHTFALIFALARRLPEAIDKVRSGNFSPDGLMGFDLKGKTIGIVGLGHIGKYVARIAHGLGMKIIAQDKYPDKKFVKDYGIKYVSLNKLLQEADIVSLHTPYNKSTHHLINKENINLFKKGSLLINTSRGGLVETEAIMLGLKKKILAGAGLDVLEEENFIKEEKELLSKPFQSKSDLKIVIQGHILIDDPRVIVTPHSAFNSKEAMERILDTTIINIRAFIKGKHVNKI